MLATLRHLGVAILWFLLALVLGLAAAGIAGASNRPPVNGSRPELTWTTDRRLDPELAAAASDLTALSGQVDALGTIGRQALVALVDRDVPTLRAAADAGQARLIEIGLASAALRTRLGAIPGFGPDDVTRIGSALRVRYDRLVTALATTADLAASWAQLTHATIVATALSTSLADHDALTGRAAGLGARGDFRAAQLVPECRGRGKGGVGAGEDQQGRSKITARAEARGSPGERIVIGQAGRQGRRHDGRVGQLRP